MIGIFDSGSGGLTVLRAVRALLPHADIVYFGDTKHAPYGERTREELSELTAEALRFLLTRGATSIVSACNSVSASLAISLFDTLAVAPERLIEMVGPTVASFRGSDARVLVCATRATIDSHIYQSAFHMIGKDVTALAIPALAGAIEAGASTEEVEVIIREAFASVEVETYDTVLLACTHYPLVLSSFRAVLGDATSIINPAERVASRVAELWGTKETGTGKLTFILSRPSEPFGRFVAELFPDVPHTLEVLE